MAITVTRISTAAASPAWALWERIRFGKSSLVGLAGRSRALRQSLASGFVETIEALHDQRYRGHHVPELCHVVKRALKIDDTLDVRGARRGRYV
jgi:Amt family ammonium transporter